MAKSLGLRVTCAHVVSCWSPQCDATPWGQPEWKPHVKKSKLVWSHLSAQQLLIQPVNLPNLRIEIKIALKWQLFQVRKSDLYSGGMLVELRNEQTMPSMLRIPLFSFSPPAPLRTLPVTPAPPSDLVMEITCGNDQRYDVDENLLRGKIAKCQ